jgi:hypothetical protein
MAQRIADSDGSWGANVTGGARSVTLDDQAGNGLRLNEPA